VFDLAGELLIALQSWPSADSLIRVAGAGLVAASADLIGELGITREQLIDPVWCLAER